MSSAREKKYLRAIKALTAAAEAMSELPIADARGGDDPRFTLRRDIDEYAEYLDRATWWRDSNA
jgi:hypothetical protein